MVGDLLIINDGMHIPADGFLIEGSDVKTDESSMTGEADPVRKKTTAECI